MCETRTGVPGSAAVGPGRGTTGRSERHVPDALALYEGHRDRRQHSAFSVMVILLEISLKNIGLLQSFCYLNVKHPNTMRRGIRDMCGMSHLVVPGPERATGNTAGFKEPERQLSSRSPGGVAMSSLPSFLFLLGPRLASTTGGLALGAPSRAFFGDRLAPRLASVLGLLCALAERT